MGRRAVEGHRGMHDGFKGRLFSGSGCLALQTDNALDALKQLLLHLRRVSTGCELQVHIVRNNIGNNTTVDAAA